MKNIFSAIKLTILCLIFFSALYPLAITGIAQFTPYKGKGETVEVGGKVVGFQKVGQDFTNNRYFWGRPSAANYNAAAGVGSNKGPSNSDYLKDVQTKVDSFLVHHPYLSKHDVPTEMVTASGSGLDPHISPHAALLQVQRVARARNISAQQITQLVEKHIQKPLFGLFGPSVVNVLALNIALDQLK
jgi:K+-transporting ATPase ATPase C chain